MRRPPESALLIAALCALWAGRSVANAAMLSDLRCENASNPLGVETPHPRLSWTFAGGGGVQRAYQIVVATSEEKLNAGEPDLWDSGRVISSQTTRIPYEGKALPSRQRCYWKVRAWDGFYQPTVYSGAATWEMGLLSPGDWKAKWIGSAPGWGPGARYFRYAFKVRQPVTRARAYVASVGYYELRINGSPVSEQVRGAGAGDESETIPYTSHDVGNLIRQKENVLAVIAGNGLRGTPKLLLQVEVSYGDGSREQIYTHAGAVNGRIWTVTSGPILGDTNAGEVYDARLEKPGWDLPDVDLPAADDWVMVNGIAPPVGRLASQLGKPLVESLFAQKLAEPRRGVFVFDAGRKLTGWAELRVKGERGTAVTLLFAEKLAEDGTVDQRNHPAMSADVFILRGGGEEKCGPHIFAHSFRYVQVVGFPGRPELGSILLKHIPNRAD